MKKILLILLLVIVIIAAGIVIFRNMLIKNGIEKGVKQALNQKLTIGDVQAGLFTTDIQVKELQVYNPSGYTDKLLADVPEIYVNYALMDIIKGFMHFPEIRLDVKELSIEKDKKGVMNVDQFKPKTQKEEKKTEDKTKEETRFLVNKLIFKINTIKYRDNTKTPPADKVLNVNLSKTFTDVSSADAIVSAVIGAAMEQMVAEGINVAINTFLQPQNAGKDTKKQGVEGLFKGLTGQKEGGTDTKKDIKLPF